jgi:uncharacterized damage-inducible protein DinB
MSNTLQEFLATATQKAADDLATAFLRLPEEERAWSPDGKARTALDQVAECALLNGYTADLIRTRAWPGSGFAGYEHARAEAMAQGWEALRALLQENTARVIAALRAVPEDALPVEIAMPWGAQTMAEIIAYPYWNMTYHQGQINYLASMLGCLDADAS